MAAYSFTYSSSKNNCTVFKSYFSIIPAPLSQKTTNDLFSAYLLLMGRIQLGQILVFFVEGQEEGQEHHLKFWQSLWMTQKQILRDIKKNHG